MLESISEDPARPQVIFVSGVGTVATATRAMKLGAYDFLEKPVEPLGLLDAVQRALERDEVLSNEKEHLEELRALRDSLTPRESQVFERVVIGRLNKQIAAELGTTEKTIKVHRGQVMRKMQADSLAHLVRMATALGAGEKVA